MVTFLVNLLAAPPVFNNDVLTRWMNLWPFKCSTIIRVKSHFYYTQFHKLYFSNLYSRSLFKLLISKKAYLRWKIYCILQVYSKHFISHDWWNAFLLSASTMTQKCSIGSWFSSFSDFHFIPYVLCWLHKCG